MRRLRRAAIAQLVERIHGKDEVSGSNPDRGSTSEFVTTKLKAAHSCGAAFSLALRASSSRIHNAA